MEDDEDFSKTIAEAGNVFLPVFLSSKEKEKEEPGLQYLRRFSMGKGKVPGKGLFSFRSFTLPLENLLAAAQGVGNVNFSPDEDGIYRRLPLLFRYRNLVLPSLPLAVADFVKEKQIIESFLLQFGHKS